MIKVMGLGKRVHSRCAEGEAVVAGFVQEVRELKNIKFVVLRDRAGLIQITAKRGDVSEEVFSKISKLTRESVVCAKGTVVKGGIAKIGLELIPTRIDVVSMAEAPLPIEFLYPESVRTSLDKRLDYRFLDLRNPKVFAIFKVQSVVDSLINDFFLRKGFIKVHTPKIIAQATESGASVFPVAYFGKEAFLAQSPQFYKQMLMASGFEKVFEIAPVFRAEKHHTPRHTCEYISIDFEVSYIDTYEDVIRVLEGMMLKVLKKVKDKCREELSLLNVEPSIPKTPFPRVTMREAYKILEGEGKSVSYLQDLDPEGERILSMFVSKEYGGEFVFLTEFPWETRPFYTMRKKEEPDWTYSFDLIWSGLEIATGGQREHRYEKLVQQCKEKGLNPKDFEFYLNFFRYGVPSHGGVGIGLERLTMQLLKLKNIRESTLLPRDPERLIP